ncbi:EamA family transporter [uncultured Shewanella sp.]|uniref:EamA family transporter n=1 Tax=uncultured Shewanella sp. TaxID=173975 RepID=UPI00261113A1|nr:EamA family transporter [uncultured Shewanella sp.]
MTTIDYFILIAFISALGNVVNSLLVAGATKKNIYNSQTCVVYSILPIFIISIFIVLINSIKIEINVFLLLCVKNVIYGLGFYLRFKAVEKLGAFNGALMAASQPVMISIFSLVFLSELLNTVQWVAILSVSIAILIPVRKNSYSIKDIASYVALPTLLFSSTVIFDRYLLTTYLSPTDFFVWDKISVFPAVLVSLFIAGKLKNISLKPTGKVFTVKVILLMTLLGLSWGIASYTYAIALAGEKAAIVTMIRNLAFPLTALAGAYIFKEKIDRIQYISLTIIVVAIVCGTIFG